MNGTISGVSCGNCKSKHPTTDDVRKCYASRYGAAQVAAANRGFQKALVDPAASFAADFPGLSDAEETRLVQERERAEDERVAAYKAQRDSQPTDPWAQVRALQAKLPDLPHMRYAIQVLDFERSPEPVWKFYAVDRPQKGKWAGRTFVSVMASDDKYPVRKPESLVSILTAIAHDPAQAASNYGHQIGKCGICHRTLSDPESIERGIGPVCADKAGW
jgi:hypothetical protein